MDKREIEDCLKEVIAECRLLKIPISYDIESFITFNKRAKSRFAACRKVKNLEGYSFVIEVGEALMKADRETVKGVLAHEVLHTCYGCYNHGNRWKFYADKMNSTYGYKIKRTSSYEELGLKAPVKEKKAKYKIVCQKCGSVFVRERKSRLVINTNDYRCKCGGKLKRMI